MPNMIVRSIYMLTQSNKISLRFFSNVMITFEERLVLLLLITLLWLSGYLRLICLLIIWWSIWALLTERFYRLLCYLFFHQILRRYWVLYYTKRIIRRWFLLSITYSLLSRRYFSESILSSSIALAAHWFLWELLLLLLASTMARCTSCLKSWRFRYRILLIFPFYVTATSDGFFPDLLTFSKKVFILIHQLIIFNIDSSFNGI